MKAAARASDERAEACGGLFAAQADAFEAFELADGLLHAGPSPVECPCEAVWQGQVPSGEPVPPPV